MYDIHKNLREMKKIIINICTPNNEEKWGDNAFAENLAFALRKLKYKIEIRCLNQWYKDDNFDISITITGKNKYKPNLNKFNIIWNISHPEVRTPQELNVFDLVLIASEKFIEIIKSDICKPLYFLPQATYKSNDSIPENYSHDILFVGNNYYDKHKFRIIIEDLLKTKFRQNFKVVGKGWRNVLPDSQIISEFVDYQEIDNFYRSAKIVLNDHHGLMKKFGFVNNRTFDLISLNVFQISDFVPSIQKYGVVTYDNPKDLENKIEEFLVDEIQRNRQIRISKKLATNISFDDRAKQIINIVQQIKR